MVQLRITREVILRALAWPEIDFHVGTKYAKATFSQGWARVLLTHEQRIRQHGFTHNSAELSLRSTCT